MGSDPGAADRLLVSIVINNYNYGRFLREAIDSALGQTYPRVEVVVVDDGSTDDSREIIAGYGDRILPVLKENGGQASAFNAGFRASRGGVVLYLDADDILLPDAAAEVARAWRPGLAKVQFALEVVDGAGHRLGRRYPTAPMPSGDLRAEVLAEGLYASPPTSGNAFGREALERMLPVPEREWGLSADNYLILLSPFFGEVLSLEAPLGLFRLHGSNNWAMRELNAGRLRDLLACDAQKHQAFRSFGQPLGLEVPADWLLGFPVHLQARLASLRIDPARHPHPEDRRLELALRGVRACWRTRQFGWRKRVFFSLWFLLAALLPAALAYRIVALSYVREKRPSLLQAVVR